MTTITITTYYYYYYYLSIRTALGSNIGSQDTLNITILLSDEPYGVISFSPDSLNIFTPEPQTDVDPFLTVERVGIFGDINVEWRFIGDVSGDFLVSQGTISLGDQISSVRLELPAIRDDVLEGNETFQVCQ